MAPRTGADRLIALLRHAASTGATLTLVVATLLVVSGCGDSSTAGTARAPSSDASTKTQGEGNKPSSLPPVSSSAASNSLAASDASPGAGPGTGFSSGASGKQGPHVTPPKGSREPAPTSEERAKATVASMRLVSPALTLGPESVSALSAVYTCDGEDTWPALKWAGVPQGTAELALFVLSVEPVDKALFFDWAVAGLSPDLEGLASGQLPKEAILGRNSFGKNDYSICPFKDQETYIFTLYALPEALSTHQGFDPIAVRREVLAQAGNAGLLAVSYGRG